MPQPPNIRYRLTVETNTWTPCELFDLEKDPEENHNLVNRSGFEETIRQMSEELIRPHYERQAESAA